MATVQGKAPGTFTYHTFQPPPFTAEEAKVYEERLAREAVDRRRAVAALSTDDLFDLVEIGLEWGMEGDQDALAELRRRL
jgi:hypothetical protein